MLCTMRVSYRKQEQVECCVQQLQQQQLLLKLKSLQGLSSGTWSTISQERQHECTGEASSHPPTMAPLLKG